MKRLAAILLLAGCGPSGPAPDATGAADLTVEYLEHVISEGAEAALESGRRKAPISKLRLSVETTSKYGEPGTTRVGDMTWSAEDLNRISWSTADKYVVADLADYTPYGPDGIGAFAAWCGDYGRDLTPRLCAKGMSLPDSLKGQ